MTEETREQATATESPVDDENSRHGESKAARLLRALLGSMLDPVENDRRAFRDLLDGNIEAAPCEMMSVMVTRADGTECLAITALSHDAEEGLDKVDSFVQEVVVPVLRDGEKVTIRLHTMGPEIFSGNATKTMGPADLSDHVAAGQAEEAAERGRERYEEHTARWEECKDCDDLACPIRINEPPTDNTPSA